jgi:hypothetical protein
MMHEDASFFEWASDFEKYKLLLTPLSKISDEDAIEVCREVGLVNALILLRDEKGITVVDHTYEITIFFSGVIVSTKNAKAYAFPQSQMFDTIRELGYALPYKGQSLFELGIAIDKTLNK